ncbi:amino acid adenylation domain-containing protein, partial [Mucilaginibacter sp. OK098]
NALKDHLLEELGWVKEAEEKVIPAQANHDHEPIAVIGMGCRFPGAKDPEAFWELLRDGVDAIREVPRERWDVEHYYDPDPDKPGKIYTRHGGFIDNVDQFDSKFFGIAPNEADYIDPQQRLLLEVSWEALENAGIQPDHLNNTPTGIFVGIGQNDYGQFHLENSRTNDINTYTGTGNSYSFAAGRISYFLGTQGPSISIDTACSSSLVTVNMACQSLRNGESNLALAGGVQLMLTPQSSIFLSKSKALSPDGKCKTFSDDANGYVRGEGCGMVVLKRLSDAIRDNDRILAVVRGVAINHDGRSSGLTVPNGQSQETLIKKAMEIAAVNPGEISYVEAHGTGTSLGDPIEMGAIARTLAANRGDNEPLLVGSVKTNIGHLEQAAGIASLIKVMLAMKHKQIPAHLNFSAPSSHIEWSEIQVKIPVNLTNWSPKSGRRIASVSSFGLSGTNAHIILEEPPLQITEHPVVEKPVQLFALSAKNNETLNNLAANYIHFFKNNDDADFSDICYTVNTGRAKMPHRLAFSAENKTEAINKLQLFIEGDTKKGIASGKLLNPANTTTAFLFSGQGSQYPAMGRELFNAHLVFKENLLKCETVLNDYLDIPLLEIIFPANGDEELIHQTRYAQPAIFAFEYALAKLWMSLGIKPAYIMGHSLGELTAACIAGVFTLEDGLKLVAKRAQLMQGISIAGGMMSLLTSVEKAKHVIDRYKNDLTIAAFNGPEHFVLSGSVKALKDADAELDSEGIPHVMLNVSHAFHSSHMDVILDEFRKTVADVQFNEPNIPLVSNITGKIAGKEIAGPEYWVSQIISPVCFLQGIKELEVKDCALFLEIGPDASLLTMAKSCLASPEKIKFMSSARYKAHAWRLLTDNLAELFVAGFPLDLKEFDAPYKPHLVGAPLYPFQRRRHWNGPLPTEPVAGPPTHVLTSQSIIIRDAAPGIKMSEMKVSETDTQPDRNAIIRILSDMVNKFSGLDAGEDDLTISFMELGLDSLILVKMIDAIKDKFGIKLSMKQFFDELSSIDALANYLSAAGISIEQPTDLALPAPVIIETLGSNALSSDLLKKLEELSKRIESLEASPAKVLNKSTVAPEPGKPSGKLNFKAVKLHEDVPFTTVQSNFIVSFVQRYNKRTALSKAYAQKHRHVLADWINSIDFRLSLKEFLYPIVSEWSSGSKFRDIDGNNYVDIGLGYGVNFFGNSPGFIKEAIQAQLIEGMELATQSDIAGEVAQLIHELTGVERVVFSNTGTEAVMAAMRIARTKTGKKKIAIFTGSYHGTFDGVLAQMESRGDEYFASPIGPGIPQGYADDVLVLTLGAEESFNIIEKYAHEIAAVMVEPVQSRRPGFQPVEFLKKLRDVTQKNGIALIFDEIITGFRIHPGGAQAHFGIYADIVTYGKIPGGGMPIGIVAGKKEYIDTIDGGWWQYGDDSYPPVEMTFFGGTFCKHPLTMAAAKASLLKMKHEGPALQERVNKLTVYFAKVLNSFFEEISVPVKIVHFGSLFRFESFGKYSLVFQPIEMSLLFYLMMEKGVYTWERRVCFFSTEHTYEDADKIIEVVKACVQELLNNGFFAEREIIAALPVKTPASFAAPVTFSLTDAQKQLWLLAELDDAGSQAYNVSTTLQLKGKLNKQLLQNALDKVIARHEGLRTYISPDGEHQVVLQKLPYTIVYTEAHGTDNKGKQEYADKWIEEGSLVKFELGKGPLFRIQVLQLSDDEYLLQFIAHHIILDGWSFGVVLFDLGAFYNESASGRQAQLPEALSFREYAGMLDKSLADPAMDAMKVYWNKKLSGKTTPLQLPADFQRPANKNYKAARCTRKFPQSFNIKLKDFSRQNDCTPFMLMISAYAAFLHRCCDTDELIIGMPVSGRNFENDKNVAGYCANLLPFLSRYADDGSFIAFLKNSKKELIECFENQAYPFAKILDDLNQKGNRLQSQLVNVTFNLNPVNELPSFAALQVNWIQTPLSFAPFDLFFDITVLPDEMVLDCDYNTGLFLPETISGLLENFETFLTGVLTDPGTPVGLLPLMPLQSRKVIIEEWNNTSKYFPAGETVNGLIDKQVIANGSAIALIDGSKKISYTDLDKAAGNVAASLLENGLKAGETVGIYMDRSANWVVAIWGILKAGGVYVPLEISLPEIRLKFIAEDADIKWTLTDTLSWDKATKLKLNALAIDRIKTPPKAELNTDFPENDPDRNCYIIYTSGSTGTPKGCAITHRNLVNYLLWAKGYYFTQDKPVSSALFTSLSFDFTATPIFCCLTSGGQLEVFPEEKEAAEVMEACFKGDKKYDFLKLTPSYLGLIEGIVHGQENIGCIILGGEAVFPVHFEILKRLLPKAKVYNEYGPTEATIGCIVKELNEHDPFILIGKPIHNMQVYIIDKNEQLLPVGVPGEICLAGAGLSTGYLNRKELTSQKFVADPFNRGQVMYKTGDTGRWLHTGEIEYLGRIDEQVKIRGFRIEPGECTDVLITHNHIKKAVVVATKVNDAEYELTAYFVPKNEDTIPAATELQGFMALKLPYYMVPARFVKIDEIPLTTNGKVDKVSLPVWMDNHQPQIDFIAPHTYSQKTVAKIWSDILGVNSPGLLDDFFASGGHSLKAAKMVAAILGETGIKIPIKTIFNAKTLGELANIVEHTEAEGYEPIPQLPAANDYQLSHPQKRIWIANQLSEDPGIFNMTGFYEITGDLDVKAFSNALELIVERHDILRTVFTSFSAEPKQRVLSTNEYGFKMKTADLSGEANASEKAMELLREENKLPFNLEKGPLLRSLLCKAGDEKYYFSISLHHILLDGWSTGLFIGELSENYALLIAGKSISREPLKVQYRDFAAWHSNHIASKQTDASKTYWQQQFSKIPPRLNLPVDRPRHDYLTYDGKQLSMTIEPELHSKLNAVARERGVTLYVIVLSAIYVTLFPYANGEDILLGVETAERRHPDLQKMLGFFLNTVVLRAGFNKEDDLLKVISEVNKVVNDGLAHQDYPFDLLLHELKIPREQNRTPLFDVQVDYVPNMYDNNYDDGIMTGQGLEMKYIVPEVRVTQYDISFLITDKVDFLKVDVVYNNHLFSEHTIATIAANYKEILTAIAKDQTLTVGSVMPENKKESRSKKISLKLNF